MQLDRQKKVHFSQAIFMVGLIVIYIMCLFILVNSFIYFESLVTAIK